MLNKEEKTNRHLKIFADGTRGGTGAPGLGPPMQPYWPFYWLTARQAAKKRNEANTSLDRVSSDTTKNATFVISASSSVEVEEGLLTQVSPAAAPIGRSALIRPAAL